MRLRRESGDFSIDIAKLPKTIRKGLTGEDLIGVIVHDSTAGTYRVVDTVTEGTDEITLGDVAKYKPSTGEVTVA